MEDDILEFGVEEDDLMNCWGTNSDQDSFNELVTGFDLDPDDKRRVTNLQEPGNQIGGGQTVGNLETHPIPPYEEGNSCPDIPGSTAGRSNREPFMKTLSLEVLKKDDEVRFEE